MNPGSGNISNATIAISLLCLLGFLIYWNVNNYNTAKEDLQEDLKVQMKLAEAEFNDTVIVSMYKFVVNDTFTDDNVEVFYGDTLQVKINTVSELDSVSASKIDQVRELLNEETDEFMRRSANRKRKLDSLPGIESVLKELVFNEKDKHHFDFSDVVVFPNDSSLETEERRMIVEYTDNDKTKIISNNRSPIIYKNFVQNLEKGSFPKNFEIRKYPKKENFPKNGVTVGFTNRMLGYHDKLLVFEGYNGYLLKQLYPSLFISLILFSLIALSFFLMRRNAIEQMRLATVKNQFVANMTHELKTPISTVGVALESLRKYGGIDDPVKTKEYIDISQRELGRLQILIDKVLKMSALEEEIELVHLESVDMNKVVSDVMNSMHLYLDQKGVEHEFKVEGTDWKVMGDPVHITNVVYNLIDNAVKYGGKKPTVSIHLSEYDKKVEIKIRDSGIGIAKEYHTKIYDRFFRVPTDDTHDVKGHGLGLNYVMSVIRQLNGTIKLDSSLGSGTTFCIELPKAVS